MYISDILYIYIYNTYIISNCMCEQYIQQIYRNMTEVGFNWELVVVSVSIKLASGHALCTFACFQLRCNEIRALSVSKR